MASGSGEDLRGEEVHFEEEDNLEEDLMMRMRRFILRSHVVRSLFGSVCLHYPLG